MKLGVLLNNIGLSFAPLSAYNFTKLIIDREFIENFSDSHLYIIAQRRETTFNNFRLSPTEMEFEIWQEHNEEIVKCILPIFQSNIATDFNKGVDVRLHNRKNTIQLKSPPPYNGTQGFTIYEVDVITGETRNLIWLTPEKLLYYYWKHYIEVDLKGNFRKMLEFIVHYVGKSTEQNICDRLSKHSTFQAILANQDVLTYGNIPSNEIVILLLRIEDNNTVVQCGDEATGEEMANYLTTYNFPDDKTISIDAEKAIIKHLQPEYNKVLYKSYPNKSDLINTDFHDVIFYGFVDPITLIYDQGSIKGSRRLDERDYIVVEN